MLVDWNRSGVSTIRFFFYCFLVGSDDEELVAPRLKEKKGDERQQREFPRKLEVCGVVFALDFGGRKRGRKESWEEDNGGWRLLHHRCGRTF